MMKPLLRKKRTKDPKTSSAIQNSPSKATTKKTTTKRKSEEALLDDTERPRKRYGELQLRKFKYLLEEFDIEGKSLFDNLSW